MRIFSMLAALSVSSAAVATGVSAPTLRVAEFAPYAFLIGEWEIHEKGSPPAAIHRASWSGGGTSIRLELDILVNGKPVPHYEGMLVWNPVRRDFDMLLNLDPVAAKVQEKGRVWAAEDGTVTREIVASYAPRVIGPDGQRVGEKGAEFVFRQTFRQISADTLSTSLMRQTSTGWVPSFPGSEEVLMTRRKTQ